MTSSVPKVVFIVPYRNRPQHKYFFSVYLEKQMTEFPEYEIYFSHQCDSRTFNRGATKNIGFLAVKEKYPEHYRDITFVFNDIDTIPFAAFLEYETVHGIVKHFYGFQYALGGIVAIKGSDFEATNGYPNFWGWGMEDNVLQKRCQAIGLTIDRSQFFPIGSPNILHLFDGVSRIINRKDPWRATHDNGQDGIRTIHKLVYSLDRESQNPADNVHTVDSPHIFVINIATFMTGLRFEHEQYSKYDLREPPRKIVNPGQMGTSLFKNTATCLTFGKNSTHSSTDITDDWTHIPFYPNKEKKAEMVKQHGQQNAEAIIQYSYQHSVDPALEVIPPGMYRPQTQTQTHPHIRSRPVQTQTQLNKYSPQYAHVAGVKPRATASAHIRMGGVYR